MWKKPASHGQEGGIISGRKSKCVIKQFGITSAVAELIRHMLRKQDKLSVVYDGQLSLFRNLNSKEEWPEMNDPQIHRSTDSSVCSDSIYKIISQLKIVFICSCHLKIK